MQMGISQRAKRSLSHRPTLDADPVERACKALAASVCKQGLKDLLGPLRVAWTSKGEITIRDTQAYASALEWALDESCAWKEMAGIKPSRLAALAKRIQKHRERQRQQARRDLMKSRGRFALNPHLYDKQRDSKRRGWWNASWRVIPLHMALDQFLQEMGRAV